MPVMNPLLLVKMDKPFLGHFYPKAQQGRSGAPVELDNSGINSPPLLFSACYRTCICRNLRIVMWFSLEFESFHLSLFHCVSRVSETWRKNLTNISCKLDLTSYKHIDKVDIYRPNIPPLLLNYFANRAEVSVECPVLSCWTSTALSGEYVLYPGLDSSSRWLNYVERLVIWTCLFFFYFL